jgi:hypothetical protein
MGNWLIAPPPASSFLADASGAASGSFSNSRPHAALETRVTAEKFLLSPVRRIGPRVEFSSVLWIFEANYEILHFASYMRMEFLTLVIEGRL